MSSSPLLLRCCSQPDAGFPFAGFTVGDPKLTAHNDAVGEAAEAAAAAAAPAAPPSTALIVHRALGLSDFAEDFQDEQFEVDASGFGGLWGPDEGEGREIFREIALLRN